VERANNVAFSEALALQRAGRAQLWFYGQTEAVYGRFFQRVGPDPARLAEALAEPASGELIEVLVNPEELLAACGKKAERAVLAALTTAAGRPEVRITLYWNSRNAGHLLRALDGAGAPGGKGCDLLLAAGAGADSGQKAEEGEPPGIRWGLRPGVEGLFIPLPKAALLAGTSTPSGRGPFVAGELDRTLGQSLLI
jgi:hypothetical protein